MKKSKVFTSNRGLFGIGAFLALMMVLALGGCGSSPKEGGNMGAENKPTEQATAVIGTDESKKGTDAVAAPPEDFVKRNIDLSNFVLISGGTFEMGSPDTENWRLEDEVRHTVTISDFYMGIYEVTQAEYAEVAGENPSSFSGDDLPVEMVSWMDAVKYCNSRSEKEGLTPAYTVEGQTVTWNRSADGYRLPTEAEWEYACRAGTKTPFNTETSISAEEANYYGHYPYEIEDNYFS